MGMSGFISKTDNVMHFVLLVKQVCADLVSEVFVYYRLGYELFACSWGLHNVRNYLISHKSEAI